MLESEKLSGSNFNDWFHQLRIVLRVEKKLNVFEQPITPTPALKSPNEELEAGNAQYDRYNEVAYLMLGSMSLELQRQFKNYSPYDMLQDLKSMNYNMPNMGKTIGELHALLIEYEKDLPKKGATPQVLAIQGGRIQKPNKKPQVAKGKGKIKGKGKSKLAYALKPKNPSPTKKEHPTKDGLIGERKLKQGAVYLYVGNGVCAHIEAIGSFELVLPNCLIIVLDNCHYVPTITRGVVSYSRLVENRFVQCFTDYGISVSKNNVLYFNAIPCNGIYDIDMLNLVPNVNSIYNVSNKRAKHNLDSTYPWHCRLAHISKKHIEKLQHDWLLKSTDDESFDQCVSCLFGKMTMKLFPHQIKRATDLHGLIHTDVCGPHRHVARQGASYFITFTDDPSRYDYVYLLKHKHKVFETFKGYEGLVKHDTPNKLQQRSVKCIFIGFPQETRGYYFYFPPENKIVVVRYDKFFEKNLISQEASGRALELEEI
ncbi:retrotransposon protein, putative, ty1-copia subclass [Tanacetum coccineum]